MRVLREVAEPGSITAAAQTLNCSQSGVSQQMSALERDLEVELLERHSGGCRLTQAGELLVEHAEAVLARLELAEATLEDLRGAVSGSVSIAAFSTAAAAILPAALDTFTRRRPHASVTAVDCEPVQSLVLLKSREVDIALVYEYDLVPHATGGAIETRLLVVDQLFLALPKGHRAASSSSVRLGDLAEERWVCGTAESASFVVFERACHAAGFEPLIACRSDHFAVVLNLVAAGAGMAVLPGLARPRDDERVVIRPIANPSLSRRVLTATRRGGADRPATRAMIEILHELTEGLPA